jgi:hypothetical protein
MQKNMINRVVGGVFFITSLFMVSCEPSNEKESIVSEKKVKEEQKEVYQKEYREKKVRSKKAIAVQYKFGEPSDERLHIYQTNYNSNGYLVDSVTYRNNYRVAKEVFEYGADNKIIKRALYDSSEVLVSLLERELNANGDETSFKSFLRDTLRYSQKKGYDDKNQLTKITDYYNDGSIKSVSSYAYNSKGDVINKTEMNDLGVVLLKQDIGYDSEGRKVSEVDYDSTGTLLGKTLIKNYDANDKIQLIEKYDANDSLYAKYVFEYNVKGQETKNTIYNGLNQILRQSMTKYDANGNRVSFKLYEGELGLRGTDLTTYNDKGLEIETKTLNHQNKLQHKKVKVYNEKDLLEREINYNHLDEPEFEFKYEYTYFE